MGNVIKEAANSAHRAFWKVAEDLAVSTHGRDTRHPEEIASIAARLAYEHISPENRNPHVQQAANLAARLALGLLTSEMLEDNPVRRLNGSV